MPDLAQVQDFLNRLHEKMRYHGPDHIIFEGYSGKPERDKNRQTLLVLNEQGYGARDRIDTLFSLQAVDYYRGPFVNDNRDKTDKQTLDSGELWEFGVWIKPKRGPKHEIYVKVQPGAENKIPVCISFHFPDKGRKISYPLRS